MRVLGFPTVRRTLRTLPGCSDSKRAGCSDTTTIVGNLPSTRGWGSSSTSREFSSADGRTTVEETISTNRHNRKGLREPYTQKERKRIDIISVMILGTRSISSHIPLSEMLNQEVEPIRPIKYLDKNSLSLLKAAEDHNQASLIVINSNESDMQFVRDKNTL